MSADKAEWGPSWWTESGLDRRSNTLRHLMDESRPTGRACTDTTGYDVDVYANFASFRACKTLKDCPECRAIFAVTALERGVKL